MLNDYVFICTSISSVLPYQILVLAVLVICTPASCQPNCDRDPDAQVVILGAGLAGLGAARRLNERGIKDFLILEQRDQVGGRVQSVQFAGTTVQLGPQWVFFVDQSVPDRHPLWPLIQKCNVIKLEEEFNQYNLPVLLFSLDHSLSLIHI